MKKNRGAGFILVVLSVAACIALLVFGITIENIDGTQTTVIPSMNEIRFGIDIRGGVEAVFQPENLSDTNVTDENLNKARTIMELRLDKQNIADREITVEYAQKRIIVRFPWKSTETNFDPQTAISELGQTGVLTFQDMDGNVLVQGKNVQTATWAVSNKAPIVYLTFNEEGTREFTEATLKVSQMSDNRMAIYMDDTLISAPSCEKQISSSNCEITGIQTQEEAKRIADTISAGSLPFKLVSNSNQTISPTLGRSALDMMLLAGLIAMCLIIIFIIAFYRLPGMFAIIALIGQIAAQLLVVTITQYTLTLPGIAAIILAIGMGVDCNVITIERIKEELYNGKTIRGAIDTGYNRAFSAIIDGNVTVAIVAVLLCLLGSGSMISFGITLLTGVVFNILFGVYLSRTMNKSIGKFVKNKKLYGYSEKRSAPDGAKKIPHINFFGKRIMFFIISGCLIVFVAVMLFVNGVSLDIQFKGGSIMRYSYEGTVSLSEVESVASEALNTTVSAQETSDISNNTKEIVLNIAAQGLASETQTDLNNALNEAFPEANLNVRETNNVDPFYGAEFLRNGIWAVVLASVLMILYVWFRFRSIHGLSAGIMALLALVHDLIMVFAVFVIFRIPLNDAFVAVFLTIIGYSINDTIVVYDRIRENEKLIGSKMPLGELVNLSINQSFVRTMNTSITTIIAIASVYVVALLNNLTSITNFALPMLLGVISGYYSSVFIASPLWASYTLAKDKSKNNAKGKTKSKK